MATPDLCSSGEFPRVLPAASGALCAGTRIAHQRSGNSANLPAATFLTDMTDLLRLVRAEYREMPGLRLTQRQAQRLWNLDSTTCETILETLESTRFLRRTSNDSYMLAAGDQ
jgi:hypothetical protein